jgi:OOP family OmpA-OmpF porin
LNEYFFNIPSDSEHAYYSRETSSNNTDIFRVKLPILRNPDRFATIRGKLIDAKTGQPLGAKIIYERLPDGTDVGINQSDPTKGEYRNQITYRPVIWNTRRGKGLYF